MFHCIGQEGATFEAALDWLCLNLPGNELPLKFASGNSLHTRGGIFGFVMILFFFFKCRWCYLLVTVIE